MSGFPSIRSNPYARFRSGPVASESLRCLRNGHAIDLGELPQSCPSFSGERFLPKLLSAFLMIVWPGISSVCPAATPPEGIPSDAKVGEGISASGVEFWQHQNHLFLRMTTPQSEVKVPRFANVIRRISAGPDSEKISLQPEPTEWVLRSLPAGATILDLELDEPFQAFAPEKAIYADSAGMIWLPAKMAKVAGTTLRFEPQSHKNTIGYWSNEKDHASWEVSVPDEQSFEVDILQGCGRGHGGSTVRLEAGDVHLDFTVQETGHFQNFVWRTLGTVTLSKGLSTIALRPQNKRAGAVMDVRAVRLVSVGSRRTMTPELADPDAFTTRTSAE
jgi:hypothetical protein